MNVDFVIDNAAGQQVAHRLLRTNNLRTLLTELTYQRLITYETDKIPCFVWSCKCEQAILTETMI